MTGEAPILLDSSRIPEAGEVLGRAFFYDPLFVYIIPDETRRARLLPWFLTACVRYGHMFGEVYTSAGSVQGVAVWFTPECPAPNLFRMMRVGLLTAPLKVGLGTFARYMSLLGYLKKLHGRDAPQRHWYLSFLGIDPAGQGQGVASSLLRPVLSRADADGLACYLETMDAKNPPFFRRHGFEVVVEDDFPRGGPHFWTMKREPNSKRR